MLPYAHAPNLKKQCQCNQTMKNLDWGKKVFMKKAD